MLKAMALMIPVAKLLVAEGAQCRAVDPERLVAT
jgi:hypothetical protein